MLAGQNKKIYFVGGAVAILILIAVVAVWLLLKKPAAGPLEETLPAQVESQESTYGTLPEIKSPELNPVERTNPFKDVYKNPFGE